MYKYGRDITEFCAGNNCKISKAVIDNECRLSEKSEEEVREGLWSLYEVMFDACHRTLDREIRSISGLTGGDAKRLHEYLGLGQSICSGSLLTAVSYALSCFEVNTSMGKIVAAPTAGSCGILPAVLMITAEKFDLGREKIVDGLAVASGIGQIISTNATISGAQGGCQAECGAAAAMAAAAAVEMCGGTVGQSFDAAAMTLKNVMGLVCDPIAGLVECPCAKRNAIGVANAMLCADLALAGITTMIPFDEVVEAMYRVGLSLPRELKETALGGLASTPTGKRIKKEIMGHPVS